MSHDRHAPSPPRSSRPVPLEGAGFSVRRPFPTPRLAQVDPFLLLDEMGPEDSRPGQAKGAPDHPAPRVRDGDLHARRRDGARGLRRQRAAASVRVTVQWMTAGAGVIHSEMPAREMQTDGGRVSTASSCG